MLLVLAVVCLIAGIASYAGRPAVMSDLVTRSGRPTGFFGLLYIGAGLLLEVVAGATDHGSIWYYVCALLGIALLAFGVVCAWRMPQALQPSWFREWRAQPRPH